VNLEVKLFSCPIDLPISPYIVLLEYLYFVYNIGLVLSTTLGHILNPITAYVTEE
jgi:hypothetical protein